MINESYRNDALRHQLAQHFMNAELPSVSMFSFFSESTLEHLVDEVKGLKFVRHDNPIRYRYSTASIPAYLTELLNSDDVIEFIQSIIGKQVESINGSILRFSWKDYTILHDEEITGEGYEMIIDMTPSWEPDWGGIMAYVDGEGQVFALPVTLGAVSIVQKIHPFQSFVKYINHYAKDIDRFLVKAEIIVER